MERLTQQLQHEKAVLPSSTVQRLQALLCQKDKDIQRLQALLKEQQQQQIDLHKQLKQQQAQHLRLQPQPLAVAPGPDPFSNLACDAVDGGTPLRQQRQTAALASPQQVQRLLKVQSLAGDRSSPRGSSGVQSASVRHRSAPGSNVTLSFTELDVWPPSRAEHVPHQQPQQALQQDVDAHSGTVRATGLERSVSRNNGSSISAPVSSAGSTSMRLSVAATRALSMPLDDPPLHHLHGEPTKQQQNHQLQQSEHAAGEPASAARLAGSSKASERLQRDTSLRASRNSRLQGQSELLAAALLAESSHDSDTVAVEPLSVSLPGSLMSTEKPASSAVSRTVSGSGQGDTVLQATTSGGYDPDRLRRSLSGAAASFRPSRAHSKTGSTAGGGGSSMIRTSDAEEPTGTLMRSSSHAASIKSAMRRSSQQSEGSLRPPLQVMSAVQRNVSFGQSAGAEEARQAAHDRVGVAGKTRAALEPATRRHSSSSGTEAVTRALHGSLTGSRRQQEAVLQKAAQLLAEDSD